MKKILDGKLYNTETAKLLGKCYSDCDRNNFSFWGEYLYKTKSGAYFLYGEGGPMSKYAQSFGNDNWGYGEHIQQMTPESACKWAEKNLTADEFSTLFGEPEEAAEGKEAITLSFSVAFKRRLEKMREQSGGTKSISQIIEDKFME